MRALEHTRNFFDQQAPDWDYHLQPQKQARLQGIFDQHQSVLKQPLLDLGCGSGILLSVLPKGLSYTALDLSASMLSRLKQYYSDRDPNILQADGHKLPFRSERFNTLICFQSLPHFTNRQQLISEIHRVLKPEGIWIILHLMDHEQLNDLHRQAGKAVAEDILPEAEDLARQLRRNSFSIIECREKRDLYLVMARKK